MKHKPFEEWIFSDEDLSKGDQKALYEHLQACDACYLSEKRWSQVERLIVSAPQAAPEPGFGERWQARLEADRRRTQTVQSMLMLGLTSAGAFLFLVLSGWRFTAGAAEAFLSLSFWTTAATWLFARAQHALSIFSGSPFPAASILAGMAFFAAAGAAAIFWLKMFRTLARIQGFYRWA